MNFKKSPLLFFFLTLLWFFILPNLGNAQSISLESDRSDYKIGENILVNLNLDTAGKPINVVSASINFQKDFFDVSQIITGNSFLTLWPEKPVALESGTINFSGGVPGGFIGSNGNILSFLLKAKKAGNTVISIDKAQVFLNDGLGTEISQVSLAPLSIAIMPTISQSLVAGVALILILFIAVLLFFKIKK